MGNGGESETGPALLKGERVIVRGQGPATVCFDSGRNAVWVELDDDKGCQASFALEDTLKIKKKED